MAAALKSRNESPNTIVLALPRGGVVLGYEIAKALNLPLDIVVPRKIGSPGNPEYAIGAITETGDAIMNEHEIKYTDKEWLKKAKEEETREAQRRLAAYRAGPSPELAGKTVIIVDDGIATGYTMRAAIASVKSRDPYKIIVALPHGSKESIEQIRREVDEMIVLETPSIYWAVGAQYEEFGQVSDEEVISLLKKV